MIIYEDIFINTSTSKPLSKNQIIELFKKYNLGDLEAKNQIILHNIRLVLMQVNSKFAFSNYEKKELVSIGLLGLIKAVKTFDINKNFEFSSYATICINNEILMFMRKNNRKFDYEVSVEQSLGVNKDGIELKIQDTLNDDNDFTIDYENKEIHEFIRNIIDELPEFERKVIMMRFGFIDDKIYLQKEIADYFNISRSYVAIIIQNIVSKIGKELKEANLIDTYEKEHKLKKKNYVKK